MLVLSCRHVLENRSDHCRARHDSGMRDAEDKELQVPEHFSKVCSPSCQTQSTTYVQVCHSYWHVSNVYGQVCHAYSCTLAFDAVAMWLFLMLGRLAHVHIMRNSHIATVSKAHVRDWRADMRLSRPQLFSTLPRTSCHETYGTCK